MPADPDSIPSLDDARQRRTRRRTPAPEPADRPAEMVEFRPARAPRTGGMWVGPTSEQTRRLVAESRIRQGLSPRIDNPAVIESLAVFLRNALDTLAPDQNHRRAA